MKEKKEIALNNYKEAKANFLKDRSKENWIKFCEAKRTCMMFGILI